MAARTFLFVFLAMALQAAPSSLFYDPALDKNDEAWRQKLPEIVQPVGAELPGPDGHGRIPLRGQFNILMPKEGEVLRLRLHEISSLNIEFEDDPGTLVSWIHSHLVAFRARWPKAEQVQPLRADADPVFHRAPYITRVDPKVDFNWSGGGPTSNRPEYFAIRWEGSLVIKEAGRYRIGGESDDGVRVRIGDELVINQWQDQTQSRHSREIELTAGEHPISMEYSENAGQAVARLLWQPPGASGLTAIPTEALRTPQGEPGLWGHYVTIQDAGAPGAAKLHIMDSDFGQWNNFGRGNLDIRYQDGEIVFACGEIPLLRIPHQTPPTRFLLRGSVYLRCAHMLELPPLPLEDDIVAADTVADDSPITWTKEEGGGGEAKASLEVAEDGSVRLHCPGPSHYAKAVARIPTENSAVITLHVQQADHATGLFLQGPFGNDHRQYITANSLRALVYDPHNHEHVRERAARGHIMPESWWMRFEVGFNQILTSISLDKRIWTILRREPMESKKYEVKPEIVFGLKIDRNKEPCEIRIGPPEIRRWHRLEALAARVDVDISHSRPESRRSNAFRAVTLANDSGVDLAELAPAMRELARRSGAHHEDRDNASGRWYAIDTLMRRIVFQQWATGDRRALGDLKQAWTDSTPLFAGILSRSHAYPSLLSELHMFELWTRQDWEGLWLATERERFHLHSHTATPKNDIGRTNISKMIEEMRSIAAYHLGRPITQRRKHSLRIDRDRHTENLLAEFQAAIANNEIDLAARILTSDEFLIGFAASPTDSEFFLPVGELIRQQALSHPPLREHLSSKFSAVAGLRLATARQRWQRRDFEVIRDQFPGTEASLAAAVHLADRDFSIGRYDSARAVYQQADLQEKVALVDSLTAESAKGAPAPGAPRHGKFRMDLLHVPSLHRRKLERNQALIAAAGYVVLPDRIIVDHLSSQFAISADGKRLLWHQPSEETPQHARRPCDPVAIGDVVVAPAYFKKAKTWGLVGRHVSDGKVLWRRTLAGPVAGELMRHDGNIIALSFARDRGDGQLRLHRIAPHRGSVLSSRDVANFAYTEHGLPEPRVAAHFGRYYISLMNTLLVTDFDGKIEWMRRLPQLGIHSLGGYTSAFVPQAPQVLGDTILVQAINTPGLHAFDAHSGKPVWTHWRRDLQRTMATSDGRVVCISRGCIDTLDAKGQLLRFHSEDIAADSVIPAPDGKILIADIISRETNTQRRELRWLDPVSGEVQSCHIPQVADQYNLRGLRSDGTRLFGFLVNKSYDRGAKVSFAVLRPE